MSNFFSLYLQKPKSVFERGYLHTSKAADYHVANSGYLMMEKPDYLETLTTKEYDNDFLRFTQALEGYFYTHNNIQSTNILPTNKYIFWQIIVSELTELHQENYALHNTLADSVAIFAMGAKPIEVDILGKILISNTDDHHYLFLRKYVDYFRARHYTAAGNRVHFFNQDTFFNLAIDRITLGYAVEGETYVDVGIHGLAFTYNTAYSREENNFEYHGQSPSVPNTATTETAESADGQIQFRGK